ncbi:MAG: multicopper oxidase domain-containing protein [Cyanobacteria bacterium CRU_2_1]|nr:multicopper oxidase domain-containing protein [Cyanobacteria bacterium RU_5_0]NJR61044.1 multicopper oxidase domain-containing protein [Cyanobacteria bacterium CRU_2_1]
MNITRREALKLGLAGSGVFLSTYGFAGGAEAATETCDRKSLPLNTQLPRFSPQLLERRFEPELPIPEPLQPVLSKTYQVTRRGITFEQPIDYYEITMRKQRVEILPAKGDNPAITAEFWTYNGTAPGSLIHQTKNRESCVRFINQLGNDDNGKPICTSVHLHGMASLPQYDGYAEDLTSPGSYKDYYYPNNRASILWYHDHAVHRTSRNVYMGLAGMYVVEYAPEDFCNPEQADCLPSGEFEVPLVIQDKSFEIPQKGSNEWKLVFNDRGRQGVYADVILVNGVISPHMTVKRRKYFFRILNASASRTYQLTLSQAETIQTSGDVAYQLTIVGSDAGLLAEPVHLLPPQPLRIGVAERYGVVIDFAQFPADVKQVYLRNTTFLANLGPEPSGILRFDLLDQPVTNSCEIPSPLGIMTDREALEDRIVKTRTFRFERGNQWLINGKTWSASRIDADPGQCDIELWNLVNTGGWAHPIHIHLIDFRVIDRNGLKPPRYEQGWKDVVVLNPLETVRVVAKFAPHRGKYMMHCHNIVHEDHDMMTQFEIGKGGPDPLSDRAKPLPAPSLGSTNPPPLIEDLPCQCFEPLPTNCNVQVEPPKDCVQL